MQKIHLVQQLPALSGELSYLETESHSLRSTSVSLRATWSTRRKFKRRHREDPDWTERRVCVCVRQGASDWERGEERRRRWRTASHLRAQSSCLHGWQDVCARRSRCSLRPVNNFSTKLTYQINVVLFIYLFFTGRTGTLWFYLWSYSFIFVCFVFVWGNPCSPVLTEAFSATWQGNFRASGWTYLSSFCSSTWRKHRSKVKKRHFYCLSARKCFLWSCSGFFFL